MTNDFVPKQSERDDDTVSEIERAIGDYLDQLNSGERLDPRYCSALCVGARQ